MKKVRQWLLFNKVIKILRKNNRRPTTITVRKFVTADLINRLRGKFFFTETEEIPSDPLLNKLHIVSYFI